MKVFSNFVTMDIVKEVVVTYPPAIKSLIVNFVKDDKVVHEVHEDEEVQLMGVAEFEKPLPSGGEAKITIELVRERDGKVLKRIVLTQPVSSGSTRLVFTKPIVFGEVDRLSEKITANVTVEVCVAGTCVSRSTSTSIVVRKRLVKPSLKVVAPSEVNLGEVFHVVVKLVPPPIIYPVRELRIDYSSDKLTLIHVVTEVPNVEKGVDYVVLRDFNLRSPDICTLIFKAVAEGEAEINVKAKVVLLREEVLTEVAKVRITAPHVVKPSVEKVNVYLSDDVISFEPSERRYIVRPGVKKVHVEIYLSEPVPENYPEEYATYRGFVKVNDVRKDFEIHVRRGFDRGETTIEIPLYETEKTYTLLTCVDGVSVEHKVYVTKPAVKRIPIVRPSAPPVKIPMELLVTLGLVGAFAAAGTVYFLTKGRK